MIPSFNLKEHIIVEDYNGEAEAIAQLYHKNYHIKAGNALNQLSYPYPEALIITSFIKFFFFWKYNSFEWVFIA